MEMTTGMERRKGTGSVPFVSCQGVMRWIGYCSVVDDGQQVESVLEHWQHVERVEH
jgi:hypothetical protein